MAAAGGAKPIGKDRTGAGAAIPELPFRRILAWSWRIARATPLQFGSSLVVSVMAQQLAQYNNQVLITALTLLTAGSLAAGGAAVETGFLSFLMPDSKEMAAAMFAGIAILVILLQFAENTLSAWTDSAMVGRLQQRLHDQLIRLGPAFHQRLGVAETQQIMNVRVRTAQTILRQLLASPIQYGLAFVSATLLLMNNLAIVTQGELGILPWVLLGAVIGLPLINWQLARRLRGAMRDVALEEQGLAVEFANSATRPLEVQLLNAGAARSASFARRIASVMRVRLRAMLRNEVANQLQSATPRVLQAVALIYGVYEAFQQEGAAQAAAAVAIVGLIQFVPAVIGPLQQLLQFSITVNNARPQIDQVIGVLEAPVEIDEPAAALAPPAGDNRLVFDGVRLALKSAGPPVLDSIDHEFVPGRVTAIVGRSGSGKSSLLTLAARLRDVEAGRVTIGGVDLRRLALVELRARVAMLSQFPLLMDASVRDNLRLGCADADDAAMEAACRAVGLWPVLAANAKAGSPLEAPLHMEANKGALSGGERRLIAFARLLLAEAPIVLLDEPTTGVDALTQKILVELVRTRLASRTVLLVDHDMDFVAAVADRVCCLDRGRFVDVIEKADLFRRPSLFRELHEARRRAIGGGLDFAQPLAGSSAAGLPPAGVPKIAPGQPTPDTAKPRPPAG